LLSTRRPFFDARLEAGTKADEQKIESQSKADAQRMEAESRASAQRLVKSILKNRPISPTRT